MKLTNLLKLAAVGAIALGATGVATSASAQSWGYGVHYGYAPYYPAYRPHRYVRVYEPVFVEPTYYAPGYGGYSHYSAPGDYCAQQSQHTGATVLGGLAGAAAGANMAAHHGGRTGGALIGGLVGAVIGHQIGVENNPPPARCDARYDARYGAPNGERPYDRGYERGYDAAESRDGDRDRDEDRDADRRDERYDRNALPAPGDTLPPPPRARDTARASDNGCRMADSPVHMPDGSTEQRSVRICPDSSGHYRVVD